MNSRDEQAIGQKNGEGDFLGRSTISFSREKKSQQGRQVVSVNKYLREGSSHTHTSLGGVRKTRDEAEGS